MQWAVQQDFVHVVDLEMIDLVVLQKFIVIVIGATSGTGYAIYVYGWSMSAYYLNKDLETGTNNIFFFPLWFFLACGPAVYIALALKTIPNSKPMLLGGLEIAYMILLLLYVLFGGMTLFILGSYVDEINGDGVALCHLSEDFCLWIRVAFSSVVMSVLLLIILLPLNNDVCWKNIKKKSRPRIPANARHQQLCN